ncbi:MAG: hypothetical protein ACLUOI_11290 [Eisenbergiella sp.]
MAPGYEDSGRGLRRRRCHSGDAEAVARERIDGIDYSEVSVQQSREMNRVSGTRCEIRQADVVNCLSKETPDLVTAMKRLFLADAEALSGKSCGC